MNFIFLISILMSFFTGYSDDNRLVEVVKESPVIAIVKITKIEASPRIWSKGNYFSSQKVEYRIIEILKGDIKSGRIIVDHFISKGLPNLIPDEPELSPKIFREKNTLIIFIEPVSEQSSNCDISTFIETNSSYGVLIASEENINKVRKIFTSYKKQ